MPSPATGDAVKMPPARSCHTTLASLRVETGDDPELAGGVDQALIVHERRDVRCARRHAPRDVRAGHVAGAAEPNREVRARSIAARRVENAVGDGRDRNRKAVVLHHAPARLAGVGAHRFEAGAAVDDELGAARRVDDERRAVRQRLRRAIGLPADGARALVERERRTTPARGRRRRSRDRDGGSASSRAPTGSRTARTHARDVSSTAACRRDRARRPVPCRTRRSRPRRRRRDSATRGCACRGRR